MRSLRFTATVAVFVLLGTCGGCRWPWEPKVGPVTGTVSYPGGARAASALVRIEGESKGTFSDATGTFWLPVRGVPGDTVLVTARDGYDGRTYAATRSGNVRIVLRESVIVVRIVMDEVNPI